jgi:hypothetical protein
MDEDRSVASSRGAAPPVLKVEMPRQDAKCVAHRRGVPHQCAERAKALEIEALADQKAEMVATGQGRAGFKQPAHRFERKTVVGVLKQPKIDAGLGESLFRIHAARGEHRGDGENRPNPDVARLAGRERPEQGRRGIAQGSVGGSQMDHARYRVEEWPELQGFQNFILL